MAFRLILLVLVMALCAKASLRAQEPADPEMLAGLKSYLAPRFPASLLGIQAGDGEVVVALTIDAQGNVADSLALLATNAEFADAATGAVNDWKFEPTASATWPRREVVQFAFKRSGVVTTLSHREAAREAFVGTPKAQINTVQWSELADKPRRLNAPMPAVSNAELKASGMQPVIINFVIDSKGRVRVPIVRQFKDAKLAESILSAVRQWRYSEPVQNGEAVAVEVTRALVLPDNSPDNFPGNPSVISPNNPANSSSINSSNKQD